jgi:hypothetical protein
VGARRGPVAAAAASGVAGEGGFRLAHKQRLRLTCELEEVLGVSADEKTLVKNGSSLKRRSWLRLWQWQRARGGNTTLNRGGSAGDDDGVTTKMRPWHGGLDPRAYGGTPRTDQWSVARAQPVRRGQSARRGPGGLQGSSGRGRVGKARPRSASGLGRRSIGADAEAARRAGTTRAGMRDVVERPS